MPVNTPREEYTSFAPIWQRMRDTYAGRDAIIKAGDLYTPTLPAATPTAQEAYLPVSYTHLTLPTNREV